MSKLCSRNSKFEKSFSWPLYSVGMNACVTTAPEFESRQGQNFDVSWLCEGFTHPKCIFLIAPLLDLVIVEYETDFCHNSN